MYFIVIYIYVYIIYIYVFIYHISYRLKSCHVSTGILLLQMILPYASVHLSFRVEVTTINTQKGSDSNVVKFPLSYR